MRVLAIFFIFLVGCAGMDHKNLPYGEIKKYGIVEKTKSGSLYLEPESLAGYAEDGIESEIIEVTDIIPLQRDITFGINWCAYGLPRGDLVLVYKIWHPEVSVNGKPPSTSFEEEFSTSHEDDGPYCTGDSYKLHEDWELLPGIWRMEVLYAGAILVSKTFRVVER